MMKKAGYKYFFVLMCAALFIVLSAALFGCGEKGPPLPPENKAGKVAAPYDLKLIRMNKDIHIAWQHKTDNAVAALIPELFEISMAKTTFESCEGCPLEFKPVGRVDMPMMEFYVPVQKGFKYYFRIQAIDADNIKSPYSKTIQFEYE